MTIESELLFQKVETALNSIRPHLAVDGGNVELVEVSEDGVAYIKWLGNCEGCAMSFMTLRAGIEQTVRSIVPEIKGVEAINSQG